MTINSDKILPVDPMDRPMVWMEILGEMMIQLELEFTQPLDPDRLAKAALLTLDSEPVLGCRLVHHWRKPFWQRVPVEKNDLFILVKSQTEYESFKHATIDANIGPQMRVSLWNDTNGALLLIKVAHHVADAAGVKDIARVMTFIYERLSKDSEFEPKPNLTRPENTINLLKSIPKEDRRTLRRRFKEYMKQIQKDKNTFRLPFGNDKTDSPFYIQRTLPKDKVNSLIQYGRQNDATINDLLISAFFRAQVKTGNWDGQSNLRITTSIDMRQYLEKKKASAVANLSLSLDSLPNLGKDLGNHFRDTLKKVTTITRQVKKDSLGLGMFVYSWPFLRLFPHAFSTKAARSLMKKSDKQGNWTNTLTNMGVINNTDVIFDSKPMLARLLPPPSYPPHFWVGSSSYEGTLTISMGGYTDKKTLSECFLDAMAAELVKVVTYEN